MHTLELSHGILANMFQTKTLVRVQCYRASESFLVIVLKSILVSYCTSILFCVKNYCVVLKIELLHGCEDWILFLSYFSDANLVDGFENRIEGVCMRKMTS